MSRPRIDESSSESQAAIFAGSDGDSAAQMYLPVTAGPLLDFKLGLSR